MLTHGKSADPGFLLPPGFSSELLMLFRDDAEDFAHSEQNNLDIWNKTGMIEVIDSRTK
jgi:hypothetical protein